MTAIAVTVCVLLTGCSSQTIYSKDPAEQARTIEQLPLAGQWSQPVDGLRCRILLEQGLAIETSTVGAAFAIENVSSQSILLSSTGSPPFGANTVTWIVGQTPVAPEWMKLTQQVTTAQMRLAPGQAYVTDLARLLVPPGAGEQAVQAQFLAAGRTLNAPPVLLRVTPAAWGEPVKGSRMRLSLAQEVYSVGQPLHVRMFIHNLDHNPLVIHPPDWSTLQIDVNGDMVLMRVRTADQQYAQVDKGWIWSSDVPNSLLLAPGNYRFRLILESPELSINYRRAWHGKLVSNDAAIAVLADGAAVE